MNYKVDVQYQIDKSGPYYLCSSAHRGKPGGQKSVWTISLTEEIFSFSTSVQGKWCFNQFYWGLHLVDGAIEVLGTTRFGEKSKIAVFVDESKEGVYHGYPADFKRKTRDRPHVDILNVWRKKGYIGKHLVSKIRAGKPCLL